MKRFLLLACFVVSPVLANDVTAESFEKGFNSVDVYTEIITQVMQSEHNFVESFTGDRILVNSEIAISLDHLSAEEENKLYDILKSEKLVIDGVKVYDLSGARFLLVSKMDISSLNDFLIAEDGRFRVTGEAGIRDYFHYELSIKDYIVAAELKSKRSQLHQLAGDKQKQLINVLAKQLGKPEIAVEAALTNRLLGQQFKFPPLSPEVTSAMRSMVCAGVFKPRG